MQLTTAMEYLDGRQWMREVLMSALLLLVMAGAVHAQPNAPSGLTVSAFSSERIDISFTDNSSDETSFELERKTGAGGTYKTFYILDPNVVRYNDYSPRPSATYFYRVRACNSAGCSGYATEQSVTTPAAATPTASLSLPVTAFTDEPVIVDARGSTNVCPRPQSDGTPSVIITYGDSLGVNAEILASGYAWTTPGTYTVNITVKNCSGVSASTSGSITISNIPSASGGTTITDSCLSGGVGNDVQILVDQGSVSANTTCLQNALNRAAQRNASEQEIVLPATATYNAITPPVPNGAGSGNKYITIRSANLANMPANKRVSSANSSDMPTIQAVTSGGFGAVALDPPPGAHHYRFQGIHFQRDSNSVAISRLLFIGYGASLSTQAHHFIFDRLWVDGGPSPSGTDQQNVRVGIDSYGKYITVKDSYLGDYVLRGTGVDTSAISLSGGEGPYAVINNTLVAGSENFSISGGAHGRFATLSAATTTTATLSSTTDIAVDQPIEFKVNGNYHPQWSSIIRSVSGNNITFDPLRAVPDVPGEAEYATGIPSYLLFLHNYLYKPLRWRPGDPSSDGNTDYQIKNAIESKCGRYLIYDSNVIRWMWIGDQPYTGFVMFSSGGPNGCNSNAAEVRQVQLTRNLFRDMASGHTVIGHQHTTPVSATTRFITLRNNVNWNVGPSFDDCCPMSGVALNMDFGRYLTFINYIHNTHDMGGSGFGKISDFGSDGGVEGGTAMWWNSVHEHGDYGFRNFLGSGAQAIESQAGLTPGDTSTWNKNLIFNIGGNTYPSQGIYTTGTWSNHFVDYANGDFRLASGNAGKNAATDGTDVGADIDAVKSGIGASSTAFGTVWSSIKAVTGNWSTGASGTSFPTSAVIDDFNRANEGPSMTGWTNVNDMAGSSGRGFEVIGNQAQCNAISVNMDYKTATTYGPDVEAYVTIVDIGVGVDSSGIAFRLSDPTGTPTGYLVIATASNNIQVYRIDGDSSVTQLGSDISQTVGDGDSIGVTMIGSTITVYYKVGAGAWNSIGTRTDSTYSGAGYIGLWADCGNPHSGKFDDLKGGTL